MQQRKAVGSILSIVGLFGIFIIAWSAIISWILILLGRTIALSLSASVLALASPLLILTLLGIILNRRIIAGGVYTAKHLIVPILFAFVIVAINLTLFF